VNMGRRWFTEGRAGNIALADDIFSENARANEVITGAAGPKRRLQERPAGSPDLSRQIVDMFSAGDKIVTRLVWPEAQAGHIGVSRRPACRWRSRALPPAARRRQSSGNIYDTGSVRSAKADRMPSWRGLPRGATLADWGAPEACNAARTCAGSRTLVPARLPSRSGRARRERLVMAAASGNELSISFWLRDSALAWEDPGIRLSGT
jgi:hypothetical protein